MKEDCRHDVSDLEMLNGQMVVTCCEMSRTIPYMKNCPGLNEFAATHNLTV